MTDEASKTAKLGTWGSSMLNKLPSRTRKTRKRIADKRGRQGVRAEIERQFD